MRRLRGAFHQTALPQEAAFDRVGGHEDVSRFGVKMVFRRPQEPKALFGDVQVPRPGFGCCVIAALAFGCCTHTVCVWCRRASRINPRNTYNFEFWEAAAFFDRTLTYRRSLS